MNSYCEAFMINFRQNKMLLLLFLLIGTICIIGCTSLISNTDISGKYVGQIKGQNVDNVYIEFNPDGTCYIHMIGGGSKGTYEVKDDIIRACYSGSGWNCHEYQISGNELIDADTKVHFMKEK